MTFATRIRPASGPASGRGASVRAGRSRVTPVMAALILALLLALSPSGARAVDVYAVSGIEVDVSAESAVEAREEAIASGQREGLRRLMRRLTVEEHFDRLPSVDGVDLDRVVRSFEVEEERVATTRYVASLRVAFVGEAVQNLLRGSGVPIVLGAAEPLLVLPVQRGDRGITIWRDDDPWRRAWEAEAERNTLLDIRLPLGDLWDVTTMRADALEGDPSEALARMAERYDAEAAIVVEAQPRQAADSGEVRLIETAVIHAWRWPDAGGFTEVEAGPNETAETLWRRAVREQMARLEAAWKRDNLVRFDDVATIPVRVSLTGIEGWAAIRRGLDSLPEITEVAIDRFSQEEAALTITFVGGRSQLARGLDRQGLMLSEEAGGWRLRREPEASDGQSRSGDSGGSS